jgi:hypothetical protein
MLNCLAGEESTPPSGAPRHIMPVYQAYEETSIPTSSTLLALLDSFKNETTAAHT